MMSNFEFIDKEADRFSANFKYMIKFDFVTNIKLGD